MSRPGNFAIYAHAGKDWEKLPSNSMRFQIVAALVHLGLSVLETPQGRQSLAEVGKLVVSEIDKKRRSNRRAPGHIYKGTPSGMSYWVGQFLQKLRGEFPPIYISSDCEGEAYTQRWDWGDDMKDYDPPRAADVAVSKDIIDNMVFARQQQDPRLAGASYNAFKFQMGIAVAHEIVHLFVGFLSGSDRTLTPPLLCLEGYKQNDRQGEVGRYWEKFFLGGVVENWSTKDHPLKERQAGTPYLFDDATKPAHGRRVSTAYMDNFIKGEFSFPIRTSSQSPTVTRRKLAPGQETTELRKEKNMRNAPVANSPPRSESSSISYRRIPPNVPQSSAESSSQKYYVYGRR